MGVSQTCRGYRVYIPSKHKVIESKNEASLGSDEESRYSNEKTQEQDDDDEEMGVPIFDDVPRDLKEANENDAGSRSAESKRQKHKMHQP